MIIYCVNVSVFFSFKLGSLFYSPSQEIFSPTLIRLLTGKQQLRMAEISRMHLRAVRMTRKKIGDEALKEAISNLITNRITTFSSSKLILFAQSPALQPIIVKIESNHKSS